LEEIVLETIRRTAEFARNDPEHFAEYINQRQSSEITKEVRRLERELSAMKKRGAELDTVFKRMYEDSALGRVTSEQFRLLSETYSEEKAKLTEDIPALNAKLEAMRSSVVNARNFIAKAKRFTDMTELTPELLRAFVAKIIVYEKSVKHSKTAPQKILIQFRDVNILDTPEHGDMEGFTELKTTPTAAEIPA
jgi:site-specific DNA recombinase